MPVISYRLYEVKCDSQGCDGWTQQSQLSREDAIKDAISNGWLRTKRRLYCPLCRGKIASQSPPPTPDERGN